MKRLACILLIIIFITNVFTFNAMAKSSKEKVSIGKNTKQIHQENLKENLESLKSQLKNYNSKMQRERTDLLEKIADWKKKNNDKSKYIFVNGEEVKSDIEPVIKDGIMLLPIRSVITGLKADLNWDNASQTATISKNGTIIILKPNSTTAQVNGEVVPLTIPSQSINNRIVVPVRFIAINLNLKVDWDQNSGTVLIENVYSTPTPTILSTSSPTIAATATPTIAVTPTPTPTRILTPAPTNLIHKTLEQQIQELKKQISQLVRNTQEKKRLLKKLSDLKKKAFQKDDIKMIFINGNEIESDIAPMIVGNRMVLPLKTVVDGVNGKLAWNDRTKIATVTKDGVILVLQLGSKVAYVNGKKVVIDIPVQMISNHVVVPISFIALQFKLKVEWDPESGTAIIDDLFSTPTPTTAATPTPSIAATLTPTSTPTLNHTPTIQPTSTVAVSATPTPTISRTPTPVAPTSTPTTVPTTTSTPIPTQTPTPTPTPTINSTASPTP